MAVTISLASLERQRLGVACFFSAIAGHLSIRGHPPRFHPGYPPPAGKHSRHAAVHSDSVVPGEQLVDLPTPWGSTRPLENRDGSLDTSGTNTFVHLRLSDDPFGP
jgi:hypothetical protein